MNLKHILFYCCLWLSVNISAQVGIGTTEVDDSAILEIKDASHGLLLPNVSLTNKATDITTGATEGLWFYNTATQNDVVKGFYYRDTDTNQWQKQLHNVIELDGVIKTPWNVVGTTNTKAKTYLEDIYSQGKFFLRPSTDYLTISNSLSLPNNQFYIEATSTNNNAMSFGHFSNDDNPFTLNVAHGRGDRVNGFGNLNQNDWNMGAITFKGFAGGTTKLNDFASIEFLRWGTTANSQLWFKVSKDGASNTSRIMRINPSGKIRVLRNQSFNQWDSGTNNDKLIGLYGFLFAAIDNPNASRKEHMASANSIEIKPFTMNRKSLIVGEGNKAQQNKATFYIEDSSSNVPIVVNNIGQFKSNQEAKDVGLSANMVYRTADGTLKVVQ